MSDHDTTQTMTHAEADAFHGRLDGIHIRALEFATEMVEQLLDRASNAYKGNGHAPDPMLVLSAISTLANARTSASMASIAGMLRECEEALAQISEYTAEMAEACTVAAKEGN